MKIKFVMDRAGHQFGDVVELPEVEAKVIVDAGYADEYIEPVVVTEPQTVTKTETPRKEKAGK